MRTLGAKQQSLIGNPVGGPHHADLADRNRVQAVLKPDMKAALSAGDQWLVAGQRDESFAIAVDSTKLEARFAFLRVRSKQPGLGRARAHAHECGLNDKTSGAHAVKTDGGGGAAEATQVAE